MGKHPQLVRFRTEFKAMFYLTVFRSELNQVHLFLFTKELFRFSTELTMNANTQRVYSANKNRTTNQEEEETQRDCVQTIKRTLPDSKWKKKVYLIKNY